MLDALQQHLLVVNCGTDALLRALCSSGTFQRLQGACCGGRVWGAHLCAQDPPQLEVGEWLL